MNIKLPGLKQFIKIILKFILSGIIFMWMYFWAISGSPYGLFQYLFVMNGSQIFFYKEVPNHQIFEGMLKGGVGALNDRYTDYLPPVEYDRLKEIATAKYVGIGVVIGQGKDSDQAMIATVFEGTPAEEAGLKSGDIINKINGKDVKGMSLNDISQNVRGQENTEVALEVLRNGNPIETVVQRKAIVLPTVKSKMLEGSIGYIRISQFTENTGKDFGLQYNELKEKGMNKLVLDLRKNPGGLVNAAQEVGNYILKPGPLVKSKPRYSAEEVFSVKGTEQPLEMAVLVDGQSASASEILAGAIQDEQLGTIIGTKTYGKGTMQLVIPGLVGDALKITIAQYRTPNDRIIDGQGIEPDIVIDNKNADETNDLQLAKAIEVLKKD